MTQSKVIEACHSRNRATVIQHTVLKLATCFHSVAKKATCLVAHASASVCGLAEATDLDDFSKVERCSEPSHSVYSCRLQPMSSFRTAGRQRLM